MTDEELTAEARRVAAVLRDWPSAEAMAYAAGLLRDLADRLDAIPDAMTEVAAMLAVNYGRERDVGSLGPDDEVRRRIREERLLIFDRLIALAAASGGLRRLDTAFCKQCRRTTPSDPEPCPLCGGPLCSGCGRCPPCDGDIPEGSNG